MSGGTTGNAASSGTCNSLWSGFLLWSCVPVAYSFEPTEEGFRDKTEQARKLLSKKEASASIGGVYVPDASLKRNEARKKAEAIMYAEKESYYVNNNDRRR